MELPSSALFYPQRGTPADSSDPFFLRVNAELSDKGFFVAAADDLITWARTGSLMWLTFRPCLLRDRNDANVDAAVRRGAVRVCTPCVAAAGGRHHRRGNLDQQDG